MHSNTEISTPILCRNKCMYTYSTCNMWYTIAYVYARAPTYICVYTFFKIRWYSFLLIFLHAISVLTYSALATTTTGYYYQYYGCIIFNITTRSTSVYEIYAVMCIYTEIINIDDALWKKVNSISLHSTNFISNNILHNQYIIPIYC